MEPILTFVYSYYDNPQMFRRQLQEWAGYDPKHLQLIQFIVTDDCSRNHPISEVFPLPSHLNIRVFRILQKVRWNWLACRNIGAFYAASRSWILMTDMDHLVMSEDAGKLVKMLSKQRLSRGMVYLFDRVDAISLTPYKPHDDSFLMSREMFWEIGGYDEELSGNYGTSGSYRRRAFRVAQGHQRLSIPLVRFPREVIEDASTTEFERKSPGHREVTKQILRNKLAEGRSEVFSTLSFPYEELKWESK